MDNLAIILVLVSSFMHAGWNCLGKKVRPSGASFTLSVIMGMLAFVPLLLFYIDWLGEISREIWHLLILSGLFQAIYYLGLGQSYRFGNMSLMYPVSRALPVLLVPPVIGLLGWGAEFSSDKWLAFSLIVSGCIILPLWHWSDISWSHYLNSATAFAVMAAVGITGYSVVDSQALMLMRVLWPVEGVAFKSALLYLILQAITTCLWLVLFTFPFQKQRREIAQLFASHRGTLFFTGVAMFSTYSIVLAAMAFADNVSLIVALRQTSIPVGVLMGVFLLGERGSTQKWWGTGFIVFGLILVSI
ncbi:MULTISPECIES: multidrug DMT transporter permease [unclassified Endozoicomonas]|uniref:multidrug DMT transporter permease n=1 Tax=unclassified Endozoicomonas TaxID=2644528 RepID=UPI003BB74241